jgi:uncharacterized protein YjgD (DUF1641 family)
MYRRKNNLLQENILHDLQDNWEEIKQGSTIKALGTLNMASEQDKLGNVVAGDAEVLNRLEEYFEEHLNSNVIRNLEASCNINTTQNQIYQNRQLR